jgi:TMEM175 potassium channel family protein
MKKLPGPITPSRLESFSDAVLAVIITITALEIRPPHGGDLGSLTSMLPTFLAYLLGFAFIGIYWNNHHHLLRSVKKISGSVMWANLHLLFWLSLIPATTVWVGEFPNDTWPAAIFGIIGFMAGIAYYVLSRALIHADEDNKLENRLGRDWKGIISQILYGLGIGMAFIHPLLAYSFYVLISIMWFVPDRRLSSSQDG